MIKAIVLDVDGVLVGTKEGINFPDPHPDIINAIRKINKNGIPVSLCSARPNFSMTNLIDLLELKTLHIANNGAVLFNQQENIFKINHLEHDLAIEMVEQAEKEKIYTEVFTRDKYMIQKGYENQNTIELAKLRLTFPELVENIIDETIKSEVIRIMFVVDTNKKKEIEKFIEKYESRVDFNWSTAPSFHGWGGLVTAKNISKRSGVIKISESLQIPLESILAVGDGINDWNFMEVCGFVAAMGNAHQELKELVKTKGEHGFIGGDVDENGLLGIFNYFKI